MGDVPSPVTRSEQYLNAMATGNISDLPTPITREEEYLDYIARNGGGSGGGASIDDSAPAYNKVYSSEKVESIAEGKFDASYVEVSGGGTNLFDISNSHEHGRPNPQVGANYDDFQAANGYFTTNLIPCQNNEKFKFSCNGYPFDYFRCFMYDANQKYINAISAASIDDDGLPYFTILGSSVSYFCLVFGWSGAASTYQSLTIMKYDEFGNEKVVIDELYFNSNNVNMAKERLGIANDTLRGKKWAVAGDSFTAGGWTSEDTPTYIESGRYAGQLAVYPYLIGNHCNMTIQDLSKGGRTLALPEGETSSYNSFVNYYQSVAADADYLTMYFGINDSHQSATIPLGTISDSTTASFYGAWNVILTWLITNRPNLHIGIIVSNGCDSDDYRTATIAIANKYGIPYIDMNGDSRTPCMIRSTNATIDSSIRNQRTAAWRISSTNTHPNADAHAYEATFIENFLKSL